MLIIKQSFQKIIVASLVTVTMLGGASYLLYKSFNLGNLPGTQVTINGAGDFLSDLDLKSVELDLKILENPRFQALNSPLVDYNVYPTTKKDLFKEGR